MRLSFLYLGAFLALLSFAPEPTIASNSKTPKNAVLLSNVKTLTLRQGSKTSHRRVPAVPQLKCVGGSGKGLYDIDIMRCTNQGSDYDDENIQWSCTANLPAEFKLGSTDVICEGYANSADPYVLKGSCGVEYRLVLTGKGEEKYGKHRDRGVSDTPALEKGVATLFWIVFLLVAGWILYSMYNEYRRVPGARQVPRIGFGGGGRGGGGGGGGPGGGDPWDPPPPYPGKRSYSRQGQQEAWRPGFWSGTAAGAAAGYLAGNRGDRQQAPPARRYWPDIDYGTNPSPVTRSSSGSSSRHESTGFGSTSRR